MKPLMRTLISMYTAAHVLLAGCASVHKTTLDYNIGNITPSKIEFEEKDPQTLEELSVVVEDDKKTVGYVQRFNEIKDDIKKNEDYNSTKDIRGLAQDVETSDISNKLRLSQQIKDFGYYHTIERREISHYDESGAKLMAALTLLVPTVAVYAAYQTEKEKDFKPLTLGALVGSIGFMWIIFKTNVKDQTTYTKYYVRPYSGSKKRMD